MQGNPSDFDIKHYIALIKRKKYVALSIGLIVLSLFAWGSFFMPNIYEASTTVTIERDSVLQPLIKGVGVSRSMEDSISNIRNEITSRSIIEKIIKKLGLDADINSPVQYEALIESMQKNLNITVRGSRPNFFNISYTGDDPKKVTDIVNTITSEYIEGQMIFRRTDATDAYDFIQAQLLEYKNKLEESDRAIREFKEKHPDVVPRSESTLLTRLESLESSRMDAEIRMKELLKKRDNLQKQLSGEKELTVAIVTREGSPQTRLNYLNNQLMLLLTKYTESYPEVIKIKSEIEELKQQISEAKKPQVESSGSETSTLNPIYQQLKEELAKTEAEIESLKARSTELLRQQQEIQKIFGRMPKEQEEWTKLQRDRNVYQQIYDQLLERLENARVSKDLELTDKGEPFRVIDPAIQPLFPVKPNRVKMIILGLFLGIASGIGAVIGLDYFDRTFKDENLIESTLKIPVFAVIPKIVTEADELSAKRLDRKVFFATGGYLFIIGLIFVEEFISRYVGINIINF
ncbi:MAG: XrtA system polysaccharide chain length determinant [Nitrospirota bacterium]